MKVEPFLLALAKQSFGQQSFGRTLGVSGTTIVQWYRGGLRPREAHLAAIESVLGADRAELFTWAGAQPIELGERDGKRSPYDDGPQPLKRIMRDRGITHQGLAEHIGTTTVAVTYWTNGKRRPQPRQLVLIMDALGLPPWELFTWAAPPGDDESPAEAGPSTVNQQRTDDHHPEGDHHDQ